MNKWYYIFWAVWGLTMTLVISSIMFFTYKAIAQEPGETTRKKELMGCYVKHYSSCYNNAGYCLAEARFNPDKGLVCMADYQECFDDATKTCLTKHGVEEE